MPRTPPELERMLIAAGIDIDAIASRGGMVWLFGSRANDCATASSDWDILIVDRAAERPPHRVHHPVDLVFVDSCSFEQWCGSELASHIGAYGHPFMTERRISARPGHALPRKLRVIGERAAALRRLWPILQPSRRDREVVRLRRDAQRAWHLAREQAVPPTAFLDAEWGSLTELERRALLVESNLPVRWKNAHDEVVEFLADTQRV
jgi:hypothetical protein